MRRLALQLAGAVAMASSLTLALMVWLASWHPAPALFAFGWLVAALWAAGGLFWNGRARLGPAIAGAVLGMAAALALHVVWNDDAHLVRWIVVSVSVVAVLPLALRPLARDQLVPRPPNP